MNYKLIIRPEARVDLLDAFQWYQEQREGLGFESVDDMKLKEHQKC